MVSVAAVSVSVTSRTPVSTSRVSGLGGCDCTIPATPDCDDAVSKTAQRDVMLDPLNDISITLLGVLGRGMKSGVLEGSIMMSDVSKYENSLSGVLGCDKIMPGVLGRDKAMSGVLGHERAMSGVLGHERAISGVLGHDGAMSGVLGHDKAMSGAMACDSIVSGVLGRDFVISEEPAHGNDTTPKSRGSVPSSYGAGAELCFNDSFSRVRA